MPPSRQDEQDGIQVQPDDQIIMDLPIRLQAVTISHQPAIITGRRAAN